MDAGSQNVQLLSISLNLEIVNGFQVSICSIFELSLLSTRYKVVKVGRLFPPGGSKYF